MCDYHSYYNSRLFPRFDCSFHLDLADRRKHTNSIIVWIHRLDSRLCVLARVTLGSDSYSVSSSCPLSNNTGFSIRPVCLSFLVAISTLSLHQFLLQLCVCVELMNEAVALENIIHHKFTFRYSYPCCLCVFLSCVSCSVSRSLSLFPIRLFSLCVHFLFVSCDCRAAIKKQTHLPRYDESKSNTRHLSVIKHRFPVLVVARLSSDVH